MSGDQYACSCCGDPDGRFIFVVNADGDERRILFGQFCGAPWPTEDVLCESCEASIGPRVEAAKAKCGYVSQSDWRRFLGDLRAVLDRLAEHGGADLAAAGSS